MFALNYCTFCKAPVSRNSQLCWRCVQKYFNCCSRQNNNSVVHRNYYSPLFQSKQYTNQELNAKFFISTKSFNSQLRTNTVSSQLIQKHNALYAARRKLFLQFPLGIQLHNNVHKRIQGNFFFFSFLYFIACKNK